MIALIISLGCAYLENSVVKILEVLATLLWLRVDTNRNESSTRCINRCGSALLVKVSSGFDDRSRYVLVALVAFVGLQFWPLIKLIGYEPSLYSDK